MLSSAITLSALTLSFLPSIHHLRPAVAAPARARLPLAFVGPEDDSVSDVHEASAPASLYRKTDGGLSYKDLERGDTPVEQGDVVSIKFTATVLSTGVVVDGTRDSRTLTFVRGVPEFAVFDEALEGMRTGGRRRVLVLPSSKYSVLEDETIELDLELVAVKSGTEAALVKASRPVGAALNTAFNLFFFYTVTQFILESVGLLPTGTGSATAAIGDVAATAAPHVDTANAWAARGLEAVGLF